MLYTLPIKRTLSENASSTGFAKKSYEVADRKCGLDGVNQIANASDGWFMSGVRKFFGWLNK